MNIFIVDYKYLLHQYKRESLACIKSIINLSSDAAFLLSFIVDTNEKIIIFLTNNNKEDVFQLIMLLEIFAYFVNPHRCFFNL